MSQKLPIIKPINSKTLGYGKTLAQHWAVRMVCGRQAEQRRCQGDWKSS
jgi:hypothetical protein